MQAPVEKSLELYEVFEHPLWTEAADALLLVDSRGAIRGANQSFQDLFGYTNEELESQAVEMLIPFGYRDAHVSHRTRYERNPTPRTMGASRLLEAMRKDRSTFPVVISLSRLDVAIGPCSLATVRDLSERVAAEHNAAELQQQRLLAANFDRIARELNQTTVQRLYALSMSLQLLVAHPDCDDLVDRLSTAEQSVEATITTLETAVRHFRQPHPVGQPPRQQILTVVAETEESLGFAPAVSFVGPLDTVLNARLMAEAFPVLREALSNVARHAQASGAEVLVDASEAELRIVVRDNGRGLGEVTRRSGLDSLAARARRLDGELHIDSDDLGTTLTWQVPIA